MIDVDRIAEQRQHWYREEHVARQLGIPSARAVVEGRWRFFAAEIRHWLATRDSTEASAATPLRVLDAGCGDGINLIGLDRIFAELKQPINLIGIDYNELRVERARGLGIAGQFDVGSLADTGLADASLDFILMNHVLEHIPDKMAILAELRRVMRLGALLIVGVPNEGCTLAKLRNHVLQRSILRTTDHVHFFTAPALRRDLTTAGFQIDKVVGEGFFVPHMRVATLVGGVAAARHILTGLNKVLPSQAAGLIAVARTVAGPSR